MSELENCKPLNDKILIEFIDGDDKTQSGIILPSDEQLKARVIKVSEGFYSQSGDKIPLQTKEGDVVLLQGKKDNYQDVRLDGDKYYIASEQKVNIILGNEL